MKQIYVAEDSPTQALRVRRILTGLHDCQLTFFGDGLEIYQSCVKAPPDLLLLDLILPSLEGLAVCRLLKFSNDFKHIPVLVFSSITDEEIAAQSTAVGADAYLRKPFSNQALIDEVNRLLQIGPEENPGERPLV